MELILSAAGSGSGSAFGMNPDPYRSGSETLILGSESTKVMLLLELLVVTFLKLFQNEGKAARNLGRGNQTVKPKERNSNRLHVMYSISI